jgi:serine/threonine protein kinase
MYTIAEALDAMHTLHLKHLDVKPKNILVFEQFRVKLADLGGSESVATLARDHGGSTEKAAAAIEESEQSFNGGTLGYRAPDDSASIASDMFAFGMTCVHLINSKRPDKMQWQSDIIAAKKVLREGIYAESGLGASLIELITGCTNPYEPSLRPSAVQCKEIIAEWMIRYPFTEQDVRALESHCRGNVEVKVA